jgi:integrase
MGDAWKDLDLVFTDTLGGPLRTNNVDRRQFGPMVIKAGVPRIRFHDLRHTAASILIAQGVSIGVVSQMLGHTVLPSHSQSTYMCCLEWDEMQHPSSDERYGNWVRFGC